MSRDLIHALVVALVDLRRSDLARPATLAMLFALRNRGGAA